MIYFFVISLINVILSSSKSICTVRYGRGVNVVANVISYSFYVIVVKQTANLPLEITVLSTACANALGVWLSYAILDYLQKDRLWKVEIIVPKDSVETYDIPSIHKRDENNERAYTVMENTGIKLVKTMKGGR